MQLLMNGYITVIEAAEQLGVSSSRVRQWVLDGTLPAQKIGKAILLIPVEKVSALKRKRRLNGVGKKAA